MHDLAGPALLQRLLALPRRSLPAGTVLFRAGEAAQGFVIVLSGRIEVRLSTAHGREVLLYAVEPGQSCVQTTLGLLGDEAYTGEEVCAGPVEAVLIPRALFRDAMDSDPAFRSFVLNAFGRRMAEVTRVLERVAFGRLEPRLAEALLDLAENGAVHATQAENRCPHRIRPRGGQPPPVRSVARGADRGGPGRDPAAGRARVAAACRRGRVTKSPTAPHPQSEMLKGGFTWRAIGGPEGGGLR